MGPKIVLILGLLVSGIAQGQRVVRKKKSFNVAKAARMFYKSKNLYSAAIFLKTHLELGRPLNARLEKILLRVVMKTGVFAFLDLKQEVAKKYRKSSPTINFIMALQFFHRQDFKKSIQLLRRIPKNHYLSVEALFIRGTAYALMGKFSLANAYYKRCEKQSSKRKGSSDMPERYIAFINESCLIHRARILYEQKKFQQALNIYKSISKESYLWPYILIEKAWSYYKLKNYNRTLGLLATYNVSLLDSYFLPETDVLKALSYVRLCLWDDASKVVNKYQSHVEKAQSLKLAINKYRGKTLMGEIIKSAKRKKTTSYVGNLMFQIRKKARFNKNFKAYLMLVKERKKMARMKKTPVVRSLLRKLKIMEIKGFQVFSNYIQQHMFNFLNDLNKFSVEMNKIMVFIAAQERSLLYAAEEEPVNTKKQKITRTRGHVRNVDRSSTEQFYTINGEFWADEFGEYSYALSSRCSAKSKKVGLL